MSSVFFFVGILTHKKTCPDPRTEAGRNVVGHNVWDSHLPEVGAPCAMDLGTVGEGGAVDGAGGPYRGFGVPRVDTLYPAVCPIAIYDCTAQR